MTENNSISFGRQETSPAMEPIRPAMPRPQAPREAAPAKQKKPSGGRALESLSPRSLSITAIVALVAGSIWYAWSSDAWGKIGRLPTKAENLSVLESNLSAQKGEIAGLKGGSAVDPEALAAKEALLAKWIPYDGPKLKIQQADLIWQIAAAAGMDIENFQKSEDRRNDQAVAKTAAAAEEAGIENPYDRMWYNKFSIDSSSSEAAVLRFKELVETHPALSIDSFGVTQSGDGIRYNVVVRAHYILVNQQG